MNFYKKIIRPVLFLFDPESIHHFVFAFLKLWFRIPGMDWIFGKYYVTRDPALERNFMGIHFPNPVGLAAGFDKDAKLFGELSNLGFGFIEIGTVTPLAQPGNERPRMFRLPVDEAIINRMGFNNEGAGKAAERLRNRKPGLIIGGNIGKNKITSNENAVADYESCFRELYDYVDYFAVNVSSPNTENLRDLQEAEPLKKILLRLQEVNDELFLKSEMQKQKGRRKPVLLKIAPDLTNDQLDEIIGVVIDTNFDGIIATNTSVSRELLVTPEDKLKRIGAGGLSGKPLTRRSTEIIHYLAAHSGGKFLIIGAGGIHSPEDAIEKITAGASLVQVYTGFIYSGPGLVNKINQALLDQR